MDDMFTLERQHDDQLGNNIRKLRNPSLVQFHKILQYINIDKDGMWVWWLVTMWRLGTDCIELTEKWRCGVTVTVEQDILEKGAH